jgi:hypothetical protein
MKTRMNHAAQAILAAVMLCIAAGASADAIHKEVDSEGRITFTDRTETAPLSPPAPARSSDVAIALANRAPMNSKDAATVDNNEAARRLARAKQNRSAGTAPQPGNAADGDLVKKLNQYYLQDKKKQEREVVAAQKRSDQTSTGLYKP